MSEKRNKSAVVSVRLTHDELTRLEAMAAARGQFISTALREVTLESIRAESDPNRVRALNSKAATVWARPQRTISIWHVPGGLTPEGARGLARDLLAAADIAEQPNFEDAAWDAEHGAAS